MRVLGVVVLVGLLGTGCGHGRNRAASRTTTTSVTTTSSTSTTLSPAAAVEAAYRAGWDAYIAYGSRSDPFTPQALSAALGPYFTGDEYKRLFNFFQLERVKGEVVRGTIDLSPKVQSVDATSAVVTDCYDAHNLGSYKPDGTRTDPVTLPRTLVEVDFVLESGAWKAASVTPKGRGCTP